MEITVIRHSQTIENLQGICQGQTCGTLSDRGKEQHSNRRIALVSHGITIRVIASLCLDVDIQKTTVVDNCSLTRFRIP